MNPRLLSSASCVLAAAVLGGCAATSTTPPTAVVSPGPAASPDAAQGEVTALLAAFRPPPGATRLPARPSAVPSLLDAPPVRPGGAGLVLRTEWWTATGTPEQAQTWIGNHEPLVSNGSGSTTDSAGGTASYTMFERTPTARLATRALLVSAVAHGSSTLLRVDAEAVPIPPRPAGATIPTTVTRLVIRAQPGRGTSGTTPPAVLLATVTSPDQLRRIAGLLNALPMETPGVRNCPSASGAQLRLEFYAGTGTAPLATAIGTYSGCRSVDLTVTGVPRSAQLADGGFQDQLLALLHLRFPQQ